MSASVLTTERLVLSPLTADDAAFLGELLNEPPFQRWIGDKGVRSARDAHRYLENGPAASYRAHGYGLLRVDLAADATTVGMCGLVKRDVFDVPDLAFAFLQRYWGKGYAHEAAVAVLQQAWFELALSRVHAIVAPGNDRSVALLEKLAFTRQDMMRLPGESEDICLYSRSRTNRS